MFSKRPLMVFVLLLLSLLLMIYQTDHGPIRILSGLQLPVIIVRQRMIHLYESARIYLQDKKKLHRQVTELQHRVERLQTRLQSLEYLEEENNRLRRLLNLPRSQLKEMIFAQAISPLPDRFSGVIVINKGTNDGLYRDMPVRTVDGLVGKTIEVLPDFSKVLTLTDPNFSVAVKIKGTEVNGVLSGSGDGNCTLKYITKDENIKEGLQLITSGIDGIFPEGIPVGYIKEIREGDNLFYDITVVPIVRLESIREVIILKR